MEKLRYFKRVKGEPEVSEISKEEAKHLLEGNWKQEYLDEIFDNNRSFCLYTMFSDIWTMDEQGRVPIAGFYGTVGN